MQDHRFGKCFFLLTTFYLCTSLLLVFENSFSQIWPSVRIFCQFILASQPLIWNCLRLSIHRIQGKKILGVRGLIFILGCLASLLWIGLYTQTYLLQPSNFPQISNETSFETSSENRNDISLVFLYFMTWFYPALYERNYGLVKFVCWSSLFFCISGFRSLNWIGVAMSIFHIMCDLPFLEDNFSDMIRRRYSKQRS